MINQAGYGGAQKAIIRVAEGLAGRGHCVELWFLDQREPPPPCSVSTRILMPRPAKGLLDHLRIAASLRRQLKRADAEAVLSFLPRSNLLGQSMAWWLGVPRRVASQRNPSWSYGRVMRWLDGVVGHWGAYTKNVMVSQSAAESFAGYSGAYRRGIVVVSNGIDFEPSPLSRSEARQWFDLSGDAMLIVCAGRLTHQKNYETLLRACSRVPTVQLAIAGDGGLRSSLESLAADLRFQDRFHLLGTLPPTEVRHLLRAADIFAIPSRYEGMSNALLEALCAGLPCIASDIPAQAEVVRFPEGVEAGMMVAAEDVEGWADAIERLAGDANLRKRLSQRALQRSEAFTLEHMIEGFERAILNDMRSQS